MATLAEARATIGICNFCGVEVVKGKMTQHLKYCKQRHKDIAVRDADSTKQKTKLFSLLIEGRYNPQYWMHVELPASEPLDTLDIFLRDMWVECCEHLSAFTIDGTSYDSEPEDFYFALPGDETTVVEEVVEEEADAENAEDTVDVAGWLEEGHNIFIEDVPSALLDELRKVWDRDELVAFLKAKLKQLPRRGGFPHTPEGHEAYLSNYRQRSLLDFILTMVEDTSLDVPLGKVLTVGQTFTYAYDFGSTTYLSLKVGAEREGVVKDKEDPVEILARNNPPVMLCIVCGKPATKVEGGYYVGVEEHAYCDEHARKAKDAEMMLPIVNSPRVGVCGYTGDAEYVVDDWEEMDEEEEDDDEEEE
ncbi:MAG: hypothetical protein NVS4B11_00020 [Ktedonobacteraceae bacterium]